MIIKMFDGDSIILECFTLKKRENDIHVYMENEHLFISSNRWFGLKVKIRNFRDDPKISSLKKVEAKAIMKKGQVIDGFAIDLSYQELSKNLKRRKSNGNKKNKDKIKAPKKT